MQAFKSGYGRKGIRVSDACPTRAIRYHLARTNVGTSNDDVRRDLQREVANQRSQGNDGWTTTAEREAIRFAIWQHAENRAEYLFVEGR